MKFAVHFASFLFPDPDGARRVALAAEAAGFDTLMAIDHIVWPTEYDSVYPYSPTGKLPGGPASDLPDPLVWLAYVAALTTRIRLLTGVLVLPQREPLLVAKQVASLDSLCRGRLDLGVGVGWLREEFDAIGVPFERRGARAEECIAAMRKLWAEDDASFEGEFVKFRGMNVNPKPVNRAVPIVMGGHTAIAARRAGRIADGFFPSIGAQVDIWPVIDLMRETAEKHGRDPAAIRLMTGCPDCLPGAGGDPVAAVQERAARGVDQVILPVSAFMPDLEANLAAFGENVIRRVNN